MEILSYNRGAYKNIFFILIVFISFVFTEYPFTLISFAFSVFYIVLLKGFFYAYKSILKFFPFIIFISTVSSCINFLISPQNVYSIASFLEYLVYCFNYSLPALSVIFWCEGFADNINELVPRLGVIFPKSSFVISMVLGMLPKFRDDFKLISGSQKCVGNICKEESLIHKSLYLVDILKIFIKYELSNTKNIAENFLCRQCVDEDHFFLSPQKNIFKKPTRRDVFFKVYMLVLFFLAATLKARKNQMSVLPYVLLCLVPITINILEAIIWNLLRRKT